ncbi:hypothetical protein MANY_16330 [Mycolicibacterium anyangense]|uniref:Uncharacterized protein n=1 Tax=Mycolicibacterium anyangense TaxID=1431246 RepID=A0A6N4W2Y2_9MYCO|nr:hypothetical protein MANY_16330 [Mycolicibacterium anyangense]
MGERGFRVLVDQLAGGNQMTGDGIGGGAVQRRKLATDLRCELFGFDRFRDTRATGPRGLVGLGPVLRLGLAGASGPGPIRRIGSSTIAACSAVRTGGTPDRAPTGIALPVVNHL